MWTRLSRLLGPSLATQPDPREQTDEEHNYRNLVINGAWFGLIDGGILNYLPVFLARLGATPSILGLLTSGPALAATLSYIPGGLYAERQADQVRFATRSFLLLRICYPLVALLPFVMPQAYIPIAVVVLWTLNSAAIGVYIPSWTTVMQKAVQPRRRAGMNGTRWATYSLVTAISLTAFGYWLDRGSFPSSYQAVFLVSFAAALVSAYYFGKVRIPPFVAQTDSAHGERIGSRLRSFVAPFLENRDFARYNIATLIPRLVLFMPLGLYSIYWVDNLHATDTWIGLRGTAGYAALVVGYKLWGKMANRIGDRTLLFIFGMVAAFYPTLTALSPSVEWLLPAAVIWGLSLSAFDIGSFDILLKVCPEGRQPLFSAGANMIAGITQTIGPMLGAGLAALLGIERTLLVIGVLQLLSTGCFFILPRQAAEVEGGGGCA